MSLRSVILHLQLVLVALAALQCSSFTLRYRPRQTLLSKSRITNAPCNLFSSRCPKKNNWLSMTSDDSKEQEETEAKETEAVAENEDDDTDDSRGLVKTILLTVPLFCKFVVVLLIKFVTDLIVFPLLFLYRLAGSAKRKILKKFGKGQRFDKVNGDQ